MEIYLITNLINNMQYVGQTIYTKYDRWRTHLCGNLYIDRAIKKYGPENFKLETLEIVDEEYKLNEREIYWIDKLNTLSPNGYNILPGGNCHAGMTVSDDIEKILYKKYYPSTNLMKNKRIKMYIIPRDSLNSILDKTSCSDDINSSTDVWVEWHQNPLKFIKKYIKEDIINTISSEIHYYPSLKFLVYNQPEQCYNFLTSHYIIKSLNDGGFISFDNYELDLQSDYLGYITYNINDHDYDEYVQRIIKERVIYYNDNADELYDFLQWERKDKLFKHQNNIKKLIERNRNIDENKNRTGIKQYMLDGSFIIEYSSVNDASMATNINKNCIINCYKNRTITSGGFLWCESGNEKIIEYKIKKLQKRKSDKEKNKKKYKSQYRYKRDNTEVKQIQKQRSKIGKIPMGRRNTTK